MRQKKWEYPYKCQRKNCGAWLYNKQKDKGHCTRCGPDKDTHE